MLHEGGQSQQTSVPVPIDPNHLLLVKLASAPKSIQHLMMDVAKDSHPQVDDQNNLLINVHFNTVQEALAKAAKATPKDITFAALVLIIAMAAGSSLILLFFR